MALKDWKKIKYRGSKGYGYKNKRTGKEIQIELYDVKNAPVVWTVGHRHRAFKTYQQALKFAKDYMRKH